jgi:hypothetical protein
MEDVYRISNCGQLKYGLDGGEVWRKEGPVTRRRRSQHVAKRHARPRTSNGPL